MLFDISNVSWRCSMSSRSKAIILKCASMELLAWMAKSSVRALATVKSKLSSSQQGLRCKTSHLVYLSNGRRAKVGCRHNSFQATSARKSPKTVKGQISKWFLSLNGKPLAILIWWKKTNQLQKWTRSEKKMSLLNCKFLLQSRIALRNQNQCSPSKNATTRWRLSATSKWLPSYILHHTSLVHQAYIRCTNPSWLRAQSLRTKITGHQN